MSLQVWLPLDGNLNNQGIYNCGTLTNNGATVNTAGKIGSCYSFNGSSNYIFGSQSGLNNNTTEFSYSCWVKLNNITQTGCLFSQRTTTNNTGFAIFFANGSFYFDEGARWNFTPATTIAANQWIHICFTWEKNVGIKYYYNGVLKNSTNTTHTPSTVSTQFAIGASQNTSTTVNANYLNGYLNDVRIYNHALSEQEVKEIAKGLRLHWLISGAPCSNQNYLSTRLPAGYTEVEYIEANNGAALDTGYLATNIKTKISLEMMPLNTADSAFLGTRGNYWLFYNIGGNYWYPYSTADKTGPVMTINKKIYVDWDKGIFNAWQGTHHEYADRRRTSQAQETTSLFLFNFYQQDSRYSYARLYWCKIWDDDIKVRDYIPAKRNSDSAVGLYDRVNNTFITNARASGTITAGPVINFTPFTTFGKIEYDISGYNHIGNITADSSTMIQNTGSPRYKNYLYFNGSQYTIGIAGELSSFDFSSATLCGWLKPHNTPSGWTGTCGVQADVGNGSSKSFGFSNYAGKFTAHLNNGSYDTSHQTSALTVDQWYFCTLTISGTTLKMYLNGELVNIYTINWNSATIHANTLFACAVDLPGSDEKLNGYMTDIRLYSTVLNDDEIQELYNMGRLS